ncbi:uncharacterized protein FMAN_05493 [Fusarium mangiferae]|uniref:Uncharacterized protein n=1 Tax=Fusarium mangiferae TaxID=192010 RepID=A0A1L7SWA7_FUSMA|nr:uncharacterized protein FMAN_05493 [Fusarium mangiferae]CVK87555.1 uncharacterized protein FMAN_05493 [Fusarium mangiferae]
MIRYIGDLAIVKDIFFRIEVFWKHPQKPIPARKGLTRKSTKVKPLDSNRRSERLERTKRQLEKENVSALYETSKLRQELRKEKRALAKERSERTRQSLEIDLLRKDNISAHKNLSESQVALKEAQDRCRELEASLRSQNETTYTTQDLYTGESPITVHGSSSDDVSDDFTMPYPIEKGSKSNKYEQNIATPPPSQKRRSSVRTAATPPETPVAGPSNNTMLLAGHFPVVEDESFDLETEEIMIGHLKSDRVFRRFKEFLKTGHESSWYCVEDIAQFGYSFGSWNDSICENGEHDGVRCRQVKVTVVDSERRLCFKRDERESASSWQGGWGDW